MEKVAIFIDGGYFSKVLRDGYGSPTVDFAKLSERLSDGYQLLRTYYYNCMPYKSQTPTEGELARYNGMQSFINSLEYLDRFVVRLGKLEYRGRKQDGSPIYQQKRVDILLGCDLVLLSAKSRISKAVLLTGDSDFIPAIEIAKNEGIETELVYDPVHMPHNNLFTIVDTRIKMDQDFINSIRR